MVHSYYKPCRELDICNGLIEKYFHKQQYEKCFEGHLTLARQDYPLAECQVGYFYYDGLGVEKDLEKAVYWTRRAADHGDRDGQYNLAWFCEEAIGMERDMEQAVFWYRKAALQDQGLAVEKCRELGVDLCAPMIDREAIRKNLQCRIYPLGYLERYKYTVICTSFQGKWILSKHKKRNTWETQGGHIEDGETPLECAKRNFLRKAELKTRTSIPCATIGGSIRSPAQTEWFSLRWFTLLAFFPKARWKRQRYLTLSPLSLLIRRHRQSCMRRRRKC